MTEEQLARIEAALRPAREDDPSFRPHRDALDWIGYTAALVAEVRRLRQELERALAAKMQEPGSEAGAFNRYALDGSRRKPT
jgi:hypothetical protein